MVAVPMVFVMWDMVILVLPVCEGMICDELVYTDCSANIVFCDSFLKVCLCGHEGDIFLFGEKAPFM